MDDLVCCLIDFQLNNAECFFIDKATERGDAVASLSEVNAVRWENRQVIQRNVNDTAHQVIHFKTLHWSESKILSSKPTISRAFIDFNLACSFYSHPFFQNSVVFQINYFLQSHSSTQFSLVSRRLTSHVVILTPNLRWFPDDLLLTQSSQHPRAFRASETASTVGINAVLSCCTKRGQEGGEFEGRLSENSDDLI